MAPDRSPGHYFVWGGHQGDLSELNGHWEQQVQSWEVEHLQLCVAGGEGSRSKRWVTTWGPDTEEFTLQFPHVQLEFAERPQSLGAKIDPFHPGFVPHLPPPFLLQALKAPVPCTPPAQQAGMTSFGELGADGWAPPVPGSAPSCPVIGKAGLQEPGGN